MRALATLACVLAAGAAGAQGVPESPPASSPAEPYALDFHRGPIVASTRVTGLAGAYTGIAEGVEGFFRNPASLANRLRHSTERFDWDYVLSWLIVPEGGLDYDNDGATVPGEVGFSAVHAGLAFQLGPLGLGALVTATGYDRDERDRGGVLVSANTTELSAGLAYAFLRGELLLGAGFSARGMSLVSGEAKASYFTGAVDTGFLWRRPGRSWRLGASVRAAKLVPASETTGGFSTPPPERVAIPSQVVFGFSWLVWPKGADYNPRYPSWKDWQVPETGGDRRYVLLTADAVALGKSAEDAWNLEGWMAGAPVEAGRKETGSFHLGAEGELLHDRLKLRIGTYSEDDRTRPDEPPRAHFTGSGELRLFDLWGLRLAASGGLDVAPRYSNFLLGIGLWH